MQLLLSVLASWLASVLVFPVLPFQHWLNSRLKALWRLITFRSRGLSGRWIATFHLASPGHAENRQELVRAHHLSGNELRGHIKDRGSGKKYNFLARMVFDEVVGHYWSVDESRDIGVFKFKKGYEGLVLSGLLTVYDTKANTTSLGVEYSWHYLPPRIVRWCRPVRRGPSLIDRTGLFANDEFSSDTAIGSFVLGRAVSRQGEHTISVKGEHREVKKPWRFLNHSCEPNAKLVWEDEAIRLVATSLIMPQTELTIDYRLLPEKVGTRFECNCPICREQEERAVIGAAQPSTAADADTPHR